MKVIISHDIDHLSAWEHYKDLIIPKFIVRSFIELLLSSITYKEFFLRIKNTLLNKWNNIEQLVQFDLNNNISSTFFIGMNNGLGLSYTLKKAEKYLNYIKKNNLNVGVHGIEFDNLDKMQSEYNRFYSLYRKYDCGIRMHYLRHNKNTFQYLNTIGYLYDTSIQELKNPYKIADLWEFPLHIMDSDIIYNGSRCLKDNFDEIMRRSEEYIENAEKNDIKYLTILLHPRYFDESFIVWKNWYKEIVEYCKVNNYEFVNYNQAIAELNNDTI
jgi:hypothetical protein